MKKAFAKSTFSGEEGDKVNNLWRLTLTQKKHRLTPKPAAAVIRRVQALIGITGRGMHAGGLSSRMKSPGSTWNCIRNWQAKESCRGGRIRVAVKCVEIWRNTGGEGGPWTKTDVSESVGSKQIRYPRVVHAVNDVDLEVVPLRRVDHQVFNSVASRFALECQSLSRGPPSLPYSPDSHMHFHRQAPNSYPLYKT